MSTPRILSRSSSPSLSMEFPEAVSSGFLPLLPEPPDSNLNVVLPVDPPVPPVPPDPPPFLTDAVMHPSLYEADLSSSLTNRRDSSFLQLVTEISLVRFSGLMKADCKLTSLHYSSLQVLEDWTLKVEILAVVGFLYTAFIISMQLSGVQLSTAMCSSQSKSIRHLKPWPHIVGPISPCFMLPQGMVFISYWSESFLCTHCLREELNCLSRRSVFLCKEEIMMCLIGSLPRTEDIINPLSFGFKFHLPQYEAVIWTSFFVAMDAIVSVGYVENFPTCSANGMWMVSSTRSAKAGSLQKASHSTLSSGLSSLQIIADSIVPFFALRSGLVLIEITGFFIVRNLVPLVITLSCFYNLCITFCLIVIAFVMGGVPKLCSSSTLF